MRDVKFIKASGAWVARNWGDLIPKIMVLVMESEGVTPTHKVLNDMLFGFTTGQLSLWLFIKQDAIIGYLVTSYGLGGPAGNSACYVRQLKALEKVLFEEWEGVFEILRRDAALKGCTHIVATTSNPAVVELGSKLGAYQDTRLIWETSSNGQIS